jgi:hypothetical protein
VIIKNAVPVSARFGLALALIVGSIYLLGQSPSVKQDAKDSPCSNIVALTGNASVNCSSLTPAQQRLIQSIPTLLKQIIADQVNPNDLMSILRDLKSGQLRIENGVLRLEGTINEIKEQQSAWTLTTEQENKLRNLLVGRHATVEVVAIAADRNAQIFASGLSRALSDYNTIPGGGISVNYGLNPEIVGMRLLLTTFDSPEAKILAFALGEALGFRPDAGIDDHLAKPDRIIVVIGAKPTTDWLAVHKK